MSPSEWRITGSPASRKTANIAARRGLISLPPQPRREQHGALSAVVVAEVSAVDARGDESFRQRDLNRGDAVEQLFDPFGPLDHVHQQGVEPAQRPRAFEQAHADVRRDEVICAAVRDRSQRPFEEPRRFRVGPHDAVKIVGLFQRREGMPVAFRARVPSRAPPVELDRAVFVHRARVGDINPEQVIIETIAEALRSARRSARREFGPSSRCNWSAPAACPPVAAARRAAPVACERKPQPAGPNSFPCAFLDRGPLRGVAQAAWPPRSTTRAGQVRRSLQAARRPDLRATGRWPPASYGRARLSIGFEPGPAGARFNRARRCPRRRGARKAASPSRQARHALRPRRPSIRAAGKGPDAAFTPRSRLALPAPAPSASPSASPPASAANKAKNQKEQNRADRGFDDRADNSHAEVHAQSRKQPIADEGADDSDQEIGDHPISGAAHDLAGQPSRNKSDHKYDKEAFIRHGALHILDGPYRRFPLTTPQG